MHRLRLQRDKKQMPSGGSVMDEKEDIITNIDDILKTWAKYYKNLYTDEHISNDEKQKEQEEEMKRNLKQAINDYTIPNEGLNARITIQEILQALEEAHTHKAPGHDEIPMDLMKHIFKKDKAPQACEALVIFMNLMLRFGVWATTLEQGVIVPIFKKQGNMMKPDNYRPISLLTSLSKLYELVLNKRLYTYVEQHNILSEEQAGFRKERSTIDHILTIDTVIATRMKQKQDTYIAFLDLEKAYDKTWRLMLFEKLIHNGIKGNILRSIHTILTTAKRAVRIGNVLSDWFEMVCGVPQGSILSPLLFDIFIDDLIRMVKRKGIGVKVGDVLLCILLYADDIAIITSNAKDMQTILDVCSEFVILTRMKFNIKKSNIVTLPRKPREGQIQLMLSGQELKYKNEYVYLGAETGGYVTGKGSKESRWKSTMKRIQRASEERKREVLAISRGEENLAPHIALMYYNTHIRGRLEYACQVWGVQITKKQSEDLDRIHDEFSRQLIRLPKNTANVFAAVELGLMPLTLRRELQALRYWGTEFQRN